MKLLQCNNVNCKHVVIPASRCCFCTKENFETAGTETLHARARLAYEDARNLIVNREFDQALRLLDLAKQWCPQESGVYFYRLLAKTGSAFEGELLMHGFPTGKDGDEEHCDPDFLMAKKQATDEKEIEFYDMLASANQAICDELTETERTAFESELKEMQESIRSRAPEISQMQAELQQLQQRLMELLLEQTDLQNELTAAVSVMNNAEIVYSEKALGEVLVKVIRSDAKDLESGTVLSHYAEMSASVDQLVVARAAAEAIKKDHPWLKTLEELKQEQAELEQQIQQKQDQIRKSDKDLVEMQDRYQSLQENYANTMKALREYRFRDAVFHGSEDSLATLVYQKSGIQKNYLLRGLA